MLKLTIVKEEQVQNLDGTRLYAQGFLRTLKKEEDHATIVGLSGDLGSGKTTFVKYIAQILGVEEEIVSPTFVIAKFYNIPDGNKWKRLVHMDAYRILDPEEIRPLRLAETFANPENLVIVEWPEQLGAFFPSYATKLTLRFIDETTREIQKES